MSTALDSHRASMGMHWLGIPQKSLFLGEGWYMWYALWLAPAVIGNREYLPHRIGMIKIFKDLTRCMALSRHSVCAFSHCLSRILFLVHGYSSQENLVPVPLDSKLNVEEK